MISRFTESDLTSRTKHVVSDEDEPIVDNSSHWTRFSLPEGQLSVAQHLPDSFPDNFAEVIAHYQPWKMKGVDLGGTIRRIEGFELDGVVFVLKEFLDTGKDVLRFVRSSFYGGRANRDASTPSAQFQIVQAAKQRYWEEYGEDLPVEELLAFYIDKRSTQKFGFYAYYPPFDRELTDHEQLAVRQKLAVIDQKLAQVGIDRAEAHNYVITAGPDGEPEIVFIDTERWKVRE